MQKFVRVPHFPHQKVLKTCHFKVNPFRSVFGSFIVHSSSAPGIFHVFVFHSMLCLKLCNNAFTTINVCVTQTRC